MLFHNIHYQKPSAQINSGFKKNSVFQEVILIDMVEAKELKNEMPVAIVTYCGQLAGIADSIYVFEKTVSPYRATRCMCIKTTCYSGNRLQKCRYFLLVIERAPVSPLRGRSPGLFIIKAIG